MIVTTRHFFSIPGFNPRPGFCRAQGKALAKVHGFNWRDFVLNGIESDQLEATGDAFALALVAWARKCEAREATTGQAHG